MDSGRLFLPVSLLSWECGLMFTPLLPIVSWLFGQLATLARFVWTQGGWLGVGVICLPLISRVVHIFKKIF